MKILRYRYRGFDISSLIILITGIAKSVYRYLRIDLLSDVTISTWWHHAMGLLSDTQNCGFRMRWECRERFPRHRWLAIPTCITARAWSTCRDACRDRQLAVSFEVCGGENVSSIPGASATRHFGYPVRGPWESFPHYWPFPKWIHGSPLWVPSQKDSGAEVWCALWCKLEKSRVVSNSRCHGANVTSL